MQFNDGELKMVQWLRGQHAAWRSTRTIIVSFSILIIVVAVGLILFDGFDLAKGIVLVIGSWGLSYTVGSWSGRPEISLLLKLVEDQNPHANREDQA